MSINIKDDQVEIKNLIRGLRDLNSKAIIVGIMEDDTKDIQVIASSNEFGATIKSVKALNYMRAMAKKYGVKLSGPKRDAIIIPERSFLRSTIDDSEVQNKLIETTRFYLFRALSAINTFEEVLKRSGELLKLMIQSSIASNIPPKNHPLTIAMKRDSQTLKGTSGKLIESISYRIIKK
jgi:hypothetical protein